MDNVNSLNGSSVRDANGRLGRILSVNESKVAIAWMQKGVIAEERSFGRAELPKDVQVLTLGEGWQPLATVAGVAVSGGPSKLLTLAEDLNGMLEAKSEKAKAKKKQRREARKEKAATKVIARAEKKKVRFGKKKHSPFKNYGHLGPGPGTGHGTREVSRKTQWDCTKAGAFKQNCVKLQKTAKGTIEKTGKVKKITLKKSYKDSYNDEYKPWRATAGF